MTNKNLARFAPLALALGLAALLAAVVIFLIQRRMDDVYLRGSLALSVIGFAAAILLNPGAVQAWLGGRQARYGGNAALMIAAFLGIVAAVNYLAVRNPVRWDLTEGQTNTLAPETLEALRQLPEPVKAYGFYSSNFASSQAQARTLLERYKADAAGKLTYDFYDPIGDPATARQFNITRDGTLVLVMGEQREEITFASEQEITGALIRFAAPESRVLYFLTGHGERELEGADEQGLSQVADLLKKQNYELRPLNLQVTTTVPADARAVIVVGPLATVTADETAVLGAYLRSTPGAALVALMDPLIQTQMELDAAEPLVDYLAQEWGLALQRDVVIDFYNSFPGQPFFPLNDGYELSPITQKLQNISTVFPVARSVRLAGTAETHPALTFTPLVQAEARAWGETDADSLDDEAGPQPGEADNPGPLTLAAAAQNTQSPARLVVFGDSDFASNGASGQGANAQLFVGAVNWATTDENLINLTPKIPTTRSLMLTDALTLNVIFLVVVIVIPVAVLALGGVVWFQRRRHV